MSARIELPLVHPLEQSRALAPLRALAGLPYPFLLHSALSDEGTQGPRRARWSFFGADPFAVFRGGDHEQAIAAFRRFATHAPRGDMQRVTGAPFTGGAVGYWSYDYGRRFEKLPSLAADDLGLPDFVFALYDVVGAYDHDTQQTWLFSNGLPLEGADAATRAHERLAQFRQRLQGPARAAHVLEPGERRPLVTGTFDAPGWRRAVERVHDHIRRGDIFQANLAQRWRITQPAALAMAPALYEALAQHSAAPYAAYLGLDDHALLSASPERFLELRGEHVETRPIKGTRPRGASPGEDARLAAELLASEKDRAENVMIVDVLRNDLGRACETGTVQAAAVCELERFPQVLHLTSTVTGRLREGLDAFDLLHACFPGGSITGAPKIRAMEIIEALEPVRRHAYTGAIGYVGWEGDADWNVAIRTATVTADGLVFHAGGGITADSDPEAEYRETLDKAEGLRLAFSSILGDFRLGEAP
jgi:para-aminobenzoate synthetase component 1